MSLVPITEALRLQREDWPNALLLAQELFAILTSPAPLDTPLSVTQPATGTDQPVFKVGGIQDGDTLFQLTGKNGQPFGTITIQDGGLVFTSAPTNADGTPAVTINADGTPSLNVNAGDLALSGPLQVHGSRTVPVAPRAPNQPPGPPLFPISGGGGGVIPGVVTTGTGNTYNVDIFEKVLATATKNVQVIQLSILASETIPAGTAVLVSRLSDGTYFMQSPVWGDPGVPTP